MGYLMLAWCLVQYSVLKKGPPSPPIPTAGGQESDSTKSARMRFHQELSQLWLLSLLAISGIFAIALPGPVGTTHDRRRGISPKTDTKLDGISAILGLDPLDNIINGLGNNPRISNTLPGLLEVLQKVKDGKISNEGYARGLLGAMQAHPEYKMQYNNLDDGTKEKVRRFIAGEELSDLVKRSSDFYIPPSPGAKHHFTLMEESGRTYSSRSWLNARRGITPVIYEDAEKTKVMKVYISAPFENWGLTVKNTPAYTFVPTTVLGTQNLVKFAKQHNHRVRVSGYRHSWSPIFSQDGEILVSTLDLATATAVPDPSSLLPNPPHTGNELKTIELVENPYYDGGKHKQLVRVGSAVTNEELRRWSIHGEAKWAMAVNVIMVEITVGGSNAPICHGAGIKSKSLSDLVRKIEYVDVNGNTQLIDDPELLKAAAGSFGLLGVVTHITFEFEKMVYAIMEPKKVDVNLAIPPPEGYQVPEQIRREFSPSKVAAAQRDFEQRSNYDFFTQWFWFPFQQEVFVNCWNTTDDKTGVNTYPPPHDVMFQWVQGWIGGILNDLPVFRALPGSWQGYILGNFAHMTQPPQTAGPLKQNTHIRTYLPDALHFRRGIQNMRVSDFELLIPIPPKKDDPTKPDYAVIQQAWWDAIIASHDDARAPMRLTVELRLLGESEMLMAPQRESKFGVAGIEVVTSTAAVDDGSWAPFVQKLSDKWMALVDQSGATLNTRPHWSKEWDNFNYKNKPFREHLKNSAYVNAIPEFKRTLERIGRAQGWSLIDIKKRFSNELLDYLFFE